MQNVIYVGARLEDVYPNEIFSERPQKLIERLKEKYPLIGILFVPVNELTTAKAGVKYRGSIYWQAYQQTKEGGANG